MPAAAGRRAEGAALAELGAGGKMACCDLGPRRGQGLELGHSPGSPGAGESQGRLHGVSGQESVHQPGGEGITCPCRIDLVDRRS